MKKTMLVLAAAAVFSLPADSAPLRQDDVSREAQWVLHADVEKVAGSQLGKRLLDPTKMNPKIKVGLAFVKGLAGIDLIKDISGITIYSTSYEDADGVIVVRGHCATEQLLNLLKISQGYASENVDGHVIHRWQDGNTGKASSACFLDGAAVFSSSPDIVKAAVAVIDGKKPSIKNSATLKIPDDSKGDILLLAVKGKGAIGQVAQSSILKRSVWAGDLNLAETNGNITVAVRLRADSADVNTKIEAIVKGAIAWLSLTQDGSPGAELLNHLAVKNANGAVEVFFSCPVETFCDALEKLDDQAKTSIKPSK